MKLIEHMRPNAHAGMAYPAIFLSYDVDMHESYPWNRLILGMEMDFLAGHMER